MGEEGGKPEKKDLKLEQRHLSVNLQSVRWTVRKERRKKKRQAERREKDISEGPMLFLNLG